MLWDSKTFYTRIEIEVYVGKQSDGGSLQVSNSPADIVNRLVGGMENCNRNKQLTICIQIVGTPGRRPQ